MYKNNCFLSREKVTSGYLKVRRINRGRYKWGCNASSVIISRKLVYILGDSLIKKPCSNKILQGLQ